MKKKNPRYNKGFTLVELSVVIVIIGLIVAGVIGGQSLVRQATFRSQISEFEKYSVAYNAFKLEFDAIPGDFNKASQYWPGVPDGDGNRRITQYGKEASIATENVRFFQHLSQARLIAENFTNTWSLGVGFPKTKIDPSKGMIASGGISSSTFGYPAGGNYNITERFKAILELNVTNLPNAEYYDTFGIISPSDALSMDKKIDDGESYTGTLRSYQVGTVGTNLGACRWCGITTPLYCTTNALKACQMMYVLEK